jgi:hypothetical protein
MRALGLGVVAFVSVAALAPARASAEQVAYAWYQRTGTDRNLIDVYITAHTWPDGARYVAVAIDRYNWRLRDPVVESLRCELDRVFFQKYSDFPVQLHVEVSDGPVTCYDQHSGSWRTILLRASWDLYDDSNGNRYVSASAYIRASTVKGLYVYVAPTESALSPDVY